MEISVLTIAYNDENLIIPCINQFKLFGLRHLVLISKKLWNGKNLKHDKTENIATNLGAEVIVGNWDNEAEQRNFGLNYLNCDYILIIDPDEMFLQKDIKTILTIININEPCYRVRNMETYWKTTDYVLSPKDKHQPVIAVNPKLVKFSHRRQLISLKDNTPQVWQPVIDIEMHHLSWVKSNKQIQNKIKYFEHSKKVKFNWFEESWNKWNLDMENIIDWKKEKNIKAIYKPLPKEIKCRLLET